MSPNAHFLSSERIIISGAGISGLSLALSLSKQLVSLTPNSNFSPPSIRIYDRDLHPSKLPASREGYSISLRSDTGGIQALQKLGVLDSMIAASINGTSSDGGDSIKAGGFAIWNHEFKTIMRAKSKTPEGLPLASMRIKRSELRRILLEAVEEAGCDVSWGKHIVNINRSQSGRSGFTLTFDDGEGEECDFLIAADGSKSKIRQALRPQDGLNYAGAVQIMGNARFEGDIPQPMDKDYGLVLGGGGIGLFVSPVDSHTAVWAISYLSPSPRSLLTAPYTEEQVSELISEALERGKLFSKPFQALIKATEPSSLGMLNMMDKPPFAHAYSKTQLDEDMKVVFIGDANHAVSPFAGNGANMALQDGWDLAEQLCKHDTLGEALKAYDALSMPRARSSLRFSHFTIQFAHAEGWWLTLYILMFRFMGLLMGY